MSNRLLEELHRHADCLVSMHTTMSAYDAEVFAAYKAPPKGSGVSEQLMLTCMAQFRPRFVLVMPDAARAADTTGHTHGSIDYQLLVAGKLAFMIELGGGGRCDNDHVRQGVEGLYGTIALLGLLDRPTVAQGSLTLVKDFRSITTSHGGLFRATARPGIELKAGEVYGRIIDLYGRVLNEARFDRPTGLVAIRRDPVIHFGERLCIAAVDYGSVSF
jgi:predicted deacylase